MKRLVQVASVAVAVLVLGAGLWTSGIWRPSALAELEGKAKARAQAAHSSRASAGMFRAILCGVSPCVLVEVGGLGFLVGAGEGAADVLASRGQMRADLDGILLTDIELASIEGLPGLRKASLAAGRADPLPVYGPDGVFPAVDGANLMLTGSTSDRARLIVGAEGEDQGLAGKIVFDSGVVTVRAFAAGIAGRVYRVDFGGKSLIIVGCSAASADLVAAVRGAKQASAIMAVQAPRLREIVGQEDACITVDEAVSAAREAKLSAGLFWPLVPTPDDSLLRRAWEDVATIPAGGKFRLGEPGMVLDLTNERPAIHAPN